MYATSKDLQNVTGRWTLEILVASLVNVKTKGIDISQLRSFFSICKTESMDFHSKISKHKTFRVQHYHGFTWPERGFMSTHCEWFALKVEHSVLKVIVMDAFDVGQILMGWACKRKFLVIVVKPSVNRCHGQEKNHEDT